MDIELQNDLYFREKYLAKIRDFYHDTELIKIITGGKPGRTYCEPYLVPVHCDHCRARKNSDSTLSFTSSTASDPCAYSP